MVLAVVVGACSESKSPPPRGLRVPLPEGWAAVAGAPGELQVGPKGRVVLTLERRSVPLPAVETLTEAVEAEGGSVVRASGSVEATTVRYAKPSGSGLLAVRSLENGALLLCASTPKAEAGELDTAEALCSGVRLEAAR